MRHFYFRRTKAHYEKSPSIAATLGLFFGAFGLFYVRWWIGLAWIFPFMLILSIVHSAIGPSAPALLIGLVAALVASSVVGYFLAKGMNGHAQGLARR